MEKVIDIEERIPTFRERRKRRTNFKFIILTLLFALVLLLLLYFQSPYSEIQKIEIKGAAIVDTEFYMEASTLQTGESMWGFQSTDIENNFKQFNWVQGVEVKRNWLTTVEVRVTEWKKVAYISQNHRFYPMLENGEILERQSNFIPVDAPIFLQFDDEKLRRKTLQELAKLDVDILSSISQINATPTSVDPYAITLFMNDGYEVRAEITTLANKLSYYPSIIAQIETNKDFEKGIIDLEVGSYYRSYTDEYVLKSDVSTEEEDTQEVIAGENVQ